MTPSNNGDVGAEKSPRVEIDVVVRFTDDVGHLTAARAKVIERAVAAAVAEVFPDHRVAGLWVHRHGACRRRKSKASKSFDG